MENLRGALFMTLAMAGFAIEDALIKGLSGAIPPGQIIAVIGGGGVLSFLVWLPLTGQRVWVPEFLAPRILLRSTCEVVGTLFFVSALARIPLTTASAVIQATPLVVALGAALFLGQRVGWRRWLAILVGFLGVLIIIRPGGAGFNASVLLAIGGMLGLASRDLVTRAIKERISGIHLSMHAFATLVPAGLALALFQGNAFVVPDARQTLVLMCCVGMGLIAYLTIVAATRIGDAAIISSFRYSRMIFALIVGYIAFREIPDAPTVIGAAIVIAAGIYTLMRETRLHRASKAAAAAI